MTAIRSDSSRTSSSSAEISSTAVPASRLATTCRWMNSMLPTSRPRVGWSSTSSLRSRANSRAMTTFCWFPPDSVPALASADGVRTSEAAGQDEVVGDAERQDQSEAMTIGRYVGHAGRVDIARIAPGDVLALEDDSAGGGLAQADDPLDELILAVPGHAGDAQDLAGRDVQVDPVDGFLAAIVT